MDILSWVPWIAVSVLVSTIAFIMLNHIRTKKLPPTDEPVVGEYRIELDVGTHIIPFEGTLYYFNKLLNPRHLHTFAKTLSKKSEVSKTDLNSLQEFLKTNGHFYAMRKGRKKLAFISLHHAVETTPFFKTEEGTGKKIVYATGSIGKDVKGFQHVVFEPVNLNDYTLNPGQYDTLDKTGSFLTSLFEKAPLIQELNAEKEKNRVMQSKVDGLADEVGSLKDEVEFWKYESKRKGIEKTEEVGFKVPKWLRQVLPFGILFAIGYAVSPSIPQLAEYHPIVLSLGLVVAGYLVKKVLGK